jgi:hypothetical protein
MTELVRVTRYTPRVASRPSVRWGHPQQSFADAPGRTQDWVLGAWPPTRIEGRRGN